jgi:tRNA uridine 5-carboxymethylaminomethyl modification enzyme
MLADLDLPVLDEVVTEQVEIQSKYAGYIDRQLQDIEQLRKYENTLLPESLDYALVRGLSSEVRQKLIQIKPNSIAHAGRISGVTPAALSLLLVHLKKNRLSA